MGFTVYGVPGSPFVRATLLGFIEKSVPFHFIPMAPGENRTAEHLARHPFGRVPVLDHDGFGLYETQAILRYLDALYPAPPLQPTDAKSAARMNQIIGINDWYFFPQVGVPIGFQRVVKPQLLGQPADEAIVEAALPRAEISLRELSRLLGGGAYFAGEALSIADLVLAPQFGILMQAKEMPGLMAPHANLKDWLGRMNARPSMQQTASPKDWVSQWTKAA